MEIRIRTLLLIIVFGMYCLTTKAQPELNESPYAMFGDGSIMLDAVKPNVEDVCIVSILSDEGEPLYAKFDFSNGCAELHNGKDSVLDIIHLVPTARCSFLSIDPCAEKFYHVSPYAFCMGNPVNYVDPTGMIPDSLEAAQMAEHVYEGKGVLSGGWTCNRIYSQRESGKETGYKYGIYQRTGEDGVTEYALVFAGTDDTKDSALDYSQYMGNMDDSEIIASQYGMAVNIAKAYANKYGNAELTLVGHSLGGGLATVGSMATEKNAITFNPAGVHDNTIKALGLQDASTNQITNHIIGGEIVSMTTISNSNVNTYGNINVRPATYSSSIGIAILQSGYNHLVRHFH